jgi:hypothetical protein
LSTATRPAAAVTRAQPCNAIESALSQREKAMQIGVASMEATPARVAAMILSELGCTAAEGA